MVKGGIEDGLSWDGWRRCLCAGGTFEEQAALAGVAGEGCCALELGAGFGVAAQFGEEIAAYAGQQVVVLERSFGGEGVDELDACLRAEGHSYGYGSIEFYDGGWGCVGQLCVEVYDAGPVGLGWGAGSCVAGCDFGLQEVGAACGVDFCGSLDCGEATMDEEVVPVGAVLIEEENGRSGRVDAGPGA